MLCSPDFEDEAAGNVLLRPYFGMHRFEWPDSDGVEFHLAHGDMIRLLRDSGFAVRDLIEIKAPPTDRTEFGIPNEWARKWPGEEVWIVDRG